MTISRHIGERLRRRSPALVGFLLWLAGAIAIGTVLILIGFFITKGPLHGPIGRWDASVTRWFANRETTTRNSITAVGSDLGMTQVIIGVELVAVIVLAIVRRWRDLAFMVTALTLEASVAFTTSFVVDRPRPSVIRLDAVPPTRSFPSGHTAAAIVLYVGLAIIITPHVRQRAIRILLWVVALSLPVYVGISRVYRGMHHATDVFGSLILGVLALTAASLIGSYTASVWRRRHEADRRPDVIDEPTAHPTEAEVSS